MLFAPGAMLVFHCDPWLEGAPPPQILRAADPPLELPVNAAVAVNAEGDNLVGEVWFDIACCKCNISILLSTFLLFMTKAKWRTKALKMIEYGGLWNCCNSSGSSSKLAEFSGLLLIFRKRSWIPNNRIDASNQILRCYQLTITTLRPICKRLQQTAKPPDSDSVSIP